MPSRNCETGSGGAEIGDVERALGFFLFPTLRIRRSHVHVKFGGDSHYEAHLEDLAHPGVHVRVDESREQGVASAVDYFSISRGSEIGADCGDLAVDDS